MKRKGLSLLLALALVVSLMPAALGAEPVTPTPPEWINEEDYIIFPGDEVYLPENWAKIEALREDARNGVDIISENPDWEEGSIGACYEIGLAQLEYAMGLANTPARQRAFHSAGQAFNAAVNKRYKENGNQYDELCYRLTIEAFRGWAFYISANGLLGSYWRTQLVPALNALDMTPKDFFAVRYMEFIPPEKKADILAELERIIAEVERITVFLDGEELSMDVAPEARNGRTMVPIRAVAETLGADVEWVQDTQQIVMTRAGVTVTMTLNSTTATVNDQAVEMDVAPYATDGRTLIPARYVAEFFGQKVDWDGEKRQVLITEDKSVVGDSNLEAWALPMGAILSFLNYGTPSYFGLYGRVPKRIDDHLLQEGKVSINPREDSRDSLSGSWSIDSREDLINTVLSMTFNGHNSTFREMAADVKKRTQAEKDAISATSSTWPSYMWEYTEYVDEKWGEKGIMAWDLFRMSNLVQWGYNAGYVTYEEALELLEPAATLLCANFSSWDEAYENYLDGYNWWAREDIDAWCKENKKTLDLLSKQEGWQTWMQCRRGPYYFLLRHHPIFDDALFETGVIGLPEE